MYAGLTPKSLAFLVAFASVFFFGALVLRLGCGFGLFTPESLSDSADSGGACVIAVVVVGHARPGLRVVVGHGLKRLT